MAIIARRGNRYHGGLSRKRRPLHLGVSLRTVQRQWSYTDYRFIVGFRIDAAKTLFGLFGSDKK